MEKTSRGNLAENVVRGRKKLGLNQADFAEKVGVHPNIIKKIEAGRGEGELDTREAIAGAIGCNVGDLYFDPNSASWANSMAEAAEVLAHLGRLRPIRKAVCYYLIFRDDKYLKDLPKEAARGAQALLKVL